MQISLCMEVKIAEKAGFCPGAKYSFEVAERVAKNGRKACTLGPLLHNEQIIQYFADKGMPPHSIEDILEGKCDSVDTVVIRAHGVPGSNITSLQNAGFKIEDGTCVHVHGIYEIVEKHEKEGYTIFVYGSAKHPEVIGIVSRAKKPIVVGSVDDIPDEKYGKVCLVSQTTQRKELYEDVKKALEAKCVYLTVFDTICNATRERQDAAKKLASEVDVMLVVGGPDSNNSQKLYDICKDVPNSRSHFIQTYEDLQNEWFDSVDSVGITAGASTPDFVIDAVAYALENN